MANETQPKLSYVHDWCVAWFSKLYKNTVALKHAITQ